MTHFDVTTLAFMRDLWLGLSVGRKQVAPLKGRTEGKGLHQGLHQGLAGIGNTQCSVALDQAD
jgi:hypothetical protein